MKRQKDMKLKDKFPGSLGVQYAGEEWGNNSRKNEEMEPKQKKKIPVVDLNGNASKFQCYKKQYCIGIWNVRSMNQRKFISIQLLSHA